MKQGIVDYVQVPKLSYQFVKRAYAPLLISLSYPKRHWLPGENFHAEVWFINDLHQEFRDSMLHLKIIDRGGHQVAEWEKQIDTIPADSSARHEAIEWQVRGCVGETFQIDATLHDTSGNIISANEYVLLIGNHEEARTQCRERAEQLRAIKSKFPTADYYRFFPDLSGPERTRRFGDDPVNCTLEGPASEPVRRLTDESESRD